MTLPSTVMSTLAVLGLLSGAAHAQTVCQPVGQSGPPAYALLLKQPLVVVLPEEPKDAKLLRKAAGKTPAELASYRADLAATAAYLRAAGKFWQGGPVSYLPASEAAKLETDPKQGHLLLSMGTVSTNKYDGRRNYVETIPALTLSWAGLVTKRPGLAGLLGRSSDALEVGSWLAAYEYFYYKGYKGEHVTDVYYPSDFISAVQQMQHYIALRAEGQTDKQIEKATDAALGRNAPQLKAKTLLLDRAQLSENLPESKLAKLYPYPVQVADRATVEAAVAAADPRYLYIRYVTVYHNNGYHLLDAANGQLLSYAEFHMLRPTDLGHVQDSNLKDIYKRAVSDSKEK